MIGLLSTTDLSRVSPDARGHGPGPDITAWPGHRAQRPQAPECAHHGLRARQAQRHGHVQAAHSQSVNLHHIRSRSDPLQCLLSKMLGMSLLSPVLDHWAGVSLSARALQIPRNGGICQSGTFVQGSAVVQGYCKPRDAGICPSVRSKKHAQEENLPS